MKTANLTNTWMLLAFTMLASCTADKDPVVKKAPPLTLPEMLACHRMASWDSSAIRTKLLGNWNWEYIKCYWNPEDGNDTDFEGLQVAFKADNTVEVTLNGQVKQTAVWDMVYLNDGYFSIRTNPLVLQLPGRIMFCNERVLFSDSYVDGCDNYFKRKQQ